MPNRAQLLTLLIALPLLLTGCSSAAVSHSTGNPSVKTETASPVTAIPILESANDKPLPLDSYLLNPDQQSAIERAQHKILSDCLKRFGFTLAPPRATPQRDSDAPTTRVDGRYGKQNPELMAKWGYHPEGGLRIDQPGPDTTTRQSNPPEMIVAERGSSDPKHPFGPGGQTINGETVPDHGCFGEATKRLTGAVDGAIGNAQIAEKLKFETLKNSQEDQRTQSVFAKWSTCMKSTGLSYADPLAAMRDPEWSKSPLPSQRELQVATADALCRKTYNVVGIWYSVDFAYQEQALKDNAGAMAAAKASIEAQVNAAKQVLTN